MKFQCTKNNTRSDIIEESDSPYNSPLWVVRKKDTPEGQKQWRVVVHFRQVNAITRKFPFPSPHINALLGSLGKATAFIYRNAFSTPDRHFLYKRLPFGMINAGATFQEQVNKVVKQDDGEYAYVDNIVKSAENEDKLDEGFIDLAG